ncbi:MAG: YraN family protein [Proteobacteria bacterium]|nr:YraN family protein [Pseudomonadota bacterium]
MTRETRRRAYGRGRRAEALAAWWLRLKGYRILARGFRVAAGEIDLIARRGRVLAHIGLIGRWLAHLCSRTRYRLADVSQET